MQLSPQNLSALYTLYSQIFQQTFLKWDVLWPKLAQLVTSKSTSETHVWMDRIPQVRKWVGDRELNNASLRDYVLTNYPYELTIALDQFVIEDNKLNAFEPTVQMIAMQMKKWPDGLLFNANTGVLPQGNSSTTAITYDGVAFYSTAHPINLDYPSLGTQSNYYASGKAFTAANFGLVRENMRGLLGADQLPLGVNPKQVVVPPALEPTGIQILAQEWIAPATATYAGAANTLQPNPFYGSADLLVVPDLAGQDTTWYVNDNTMPVKPFLFQLRQAATFVMKTRPDDPAIFSRHEVQYGAYARGTAGYGPWFLSYRASA